MSFTNADKKKLDDILALDQTTIVSMHVGTLKGIFARMEAGERCAHYLKTFDMGNLTEGDKVQWTFPMEFYIAFRAALQAWRKECGESDPEKLCNSCAIGSMQPCTCAAARKS